MFKALISTIENDKEIKLKQYADDTTAFLANKQLASIYYYYYYYYFLTPFEKKFNSEDKSNETRNSLAWFHIRPPPPSPIFPCFLDLDSTAVFEP